jgi:NAD(P)H-nitrite reductase large subunit
VSQRRLVILGHGIAGLTAAGAARDVDGQLHITLAGDEPYDAYYRPRLTHDLATGIDADKIRLRPPSWYEKAGIEVLHGSAAIELDLAAGRVVLAGGRVLPYDSCVLALGSSSFVPPLEGGLPGGVHALRSAADALAIRARAQAVGVVAIAGGGLLGLETAYALARLGKRVVVLERGDSLLRRQLDAGGGEALAAVLRRAGIEVWTRSEVERTISASPSDCAGNRPEDLAGVVLKDGRQLHCGLLVVAAGVRPNIALARSAGLQTDRGGIVVDDRLQTSNPAVYACGDVASHPAGNYSIWPQAMAQGKVAGTNAAGGDATYTGVVPQTLLTVAGTSVLAVGETGQRDEPAPAAGAAAGAATGSPAEQGLASDRLEVYSADVDAGRYTKFVFRGARLAGAMLIGETALAQPAARAVQSGLSLPGLAQLPEDQRLAFVVEKIKA